MKRNFKKDTRGITLIALIITILVMVILAVVVINLAVGENGVMEQAEVAKEKTKIATIEEHCQLAMTNSRDEYIVNFFKNFNLKTNSTMQDLRKRFREDEGYDQKIIDGIFSATLNLTKVEEYLRENFATLKYNDIEISKESALYDTEIWNTLKRKWN